MSNAVAIGLTRRSVLPFEDPRPSTGASWTLSSRSTAPRGLTEKHLVEEIAGVLWQKAAASAWRRWRSIGGPWSKRWVSTTVRVKRGLDGA